MSQALKKILITSVSAGSGHVRAAQAIEAAFRQAHPRLEVKHVDLMDYVSTPFRRVYAGGYAFAVSHAPTLWGKLYEFTDKPNKGEALPPAVSAIQRLHARDFYEFFDDYSPDLVLTTHFLTPQLLSDVPPRRDIPIETVVTDYEFHHLWHHRSVRRYYVARTEMATKLRALGVEAGHAVVSGIPVHPCFVENTSRASALEKLGLESDMPTVLILSGGFGFGSLDKTVKALFQLSAPVQIVTVSGKNHQLRSALEKLAPPAHVKLRNFGYVDNMQDFMTVSDLVITKPGGLTVSECLVKGSAMLLYAPIPGQEEANANHVRKIGAGIKADSVHELAQAVGNLLASPGMLSLMRKRALENSHPRAAYTIANFAASSLLAA